MIAYYDVSFLDRCWRSIMLSMALKAADVPFSATSYRRISNSGAFWYDDCEAP